MLPENWYKYAFAILGIILLLMSLKFLSDAIYYSEAPEQAGFAIEGGDGHETADSQEKTDGHDTAKEEAAEAGPAYDPVEPLLAGADVEAGKTVFKKCAACHTTDKGGKARTGPNLYGMVGDAIAARDGFKYSPALTAYADGRSWTYEELNGFLFKPKAYVKGTKMGFAGLKKTADRANLIAWMRTLADSPVPLPGS